MKNRFFDQPFFSVASNEWKRPWSFVDAGTANDDEGGGSLPASPSPIPSPTLNPPPSPAPVPSGGDDEDNLGEKGKRALKGIREERDAAKRELAEARQQIEKMKPYIPPETYKEMIDQLEETKRQARERELELQKQKSETEEQFQTRLITAQQERDNERKAREAAEAKAEDERKQRFSFAKRTMLSNAFYANGGRDGQDDEGTTFFDLFMNARGDARTEYSPEDGNTYVIDKDGKRLMGEDGKPIPLGAWMTQLADTSPIIGTFFEPRGGAGSGGLQGTKGVKSIQTPDIEAQRRRRPENLLNEAFGLT